MFELDVTKTGRAAVRAFCCKTLGHLFAERLNGYGAGWCLMGTVVRKDHNVVALFQKRFHCVAEGLQARDVLVRARLVVVGALHNHSLARKTNS